MAMEERMPLNLDPSMMQAGQVKRRGMFGGNVGNTIANFVLNYAAMQGNQGAASVLQSLNERRLAEAKQKYDEGQYQQHRLDGMADWQAKQQWTLDHAQPEQTSYARDLIAAGIMPGTPKFNQLYGQYVQQKAQTGGSLFGNLFKDPATGQQYMPANLPPLGEEMDDPRKQGGPTPQASGGFPPFGY